MNTSYRYTGTTDEVTVCDHCGRNELKGTVIVTVLDGDSEDGTLYLGTTCASRYLTRRFGVTVTAADVRKGIKSAADAACAAADAARAAEAARKCAARDAKLREWGLDPRTCRPSDSLRALKAVEA